MDLDEKACGCSTTVGKAMIPAFASKLGVFGFTSKRRSVPHRFLHKSLRSPVPGGHRQESCVSDGVTRCVLYTPTETSQATLAPVLVLPGLGNSSVDYLELTEKLLSRGHKSVAVVPVQRWQWGLNAKGFFMADYWRGTLKPGAVLDWYFDLVDQAVSELTSEAGNECEINVLGHSAGGWLGRAYIAECAPLNLRVSTLLTLGTPNQSPPSGQLDQTRGLLRYIERNCDIADAVSNFVCVAGCGTIGKPLGKGSVAEYVAYLSYAAVCGRGDVDGDGVTPIDAACGKNGKLVVCEDCDHSMLTSNAWYGSDDMLEKWAAYLT